MYSSSIWRWSNEPEKVPKAKIARKKASRERKKDKKGKYCIG